MDVKLISEDPDLYRLCREVRSQVSNCRWTLSSAEFQVRHPDIGICLWDFRPGMPLPRDIAASPTSHLFLVHRADLPAFRKEVDVLEAHLLLKPVTRATLSAFLEQAVATQEARLPTTDALRNDRDEILQCLIRTNLRLQEYDQDRTTFLARAVHDFRAPLTALNGYCGLLLGEHLGTLTERQREVLQRMLHSSKRLSRMAADMFELSVGRHVKRRPALQKADLRESLEQALHEIAPFANDKRIAIATDIAPCKFALHFEPGQIEQVLINILDNACKFTPKAGIIDIRGYAWFWERRTSRSSVPVGAERRRRNASEPNSYRIDIRDSGSAIPQAHLDRIFEEYTSYSGGLDRSGGGLGLAITKMIVTQHDGHVWAENTETGPMFSFVLPLQRRESTVEQIQKSALEFQPGGINAKSEECSNHLSG